MSSSIPSCIGRQAANEPTGCPGSAGWTTTPTGPHRTHLNRWQGAPQSCARGVRPPLGVTHPGTPVPLMGPVTRPILASHRAPTVPVEEALTGCSPSEVGRDAAHGRGSRPSPDRRSCLPPLRSPPRPPAARTACPPATSRLEPAPRQPRSSRRSPTEAMTARKPNGSGSPSTAQPTTCPPNPVAAGRTALSSGGPEPCPAA